ncbi:unnamed protein product, partial [Ectocarpus sp. 12 AP-2014]
RVAFIRYGTATPPHTQGAAWHWPHPVLFCRYCSVVEPENLLVYSGTCNAFNECRWITVTGTASRQQGFSRECSYGIHSTTTFFLRSSSHPAFAATLAYAFPH